jgi:hypothetical protein
VWVSLQAFVYSFFVLTFPFVIFVANFRESSARALQKTERTTKFKTVVKGFENYYLAVEGG